MANNKVIMATLIITDIILGSATIYNFIEIKELKSAAANNIETQNQKSTTQNNQAISIERKTDKIDLDVSENGFSPKGFQIDAKNITTISVKNSGTHAHSFMIDSLGISQEIEQGERKNIEINIQQKEPLLLNFYSGSQGDAKDLFSGQIIVL
jgi:hypothetical protein